MSHFGRVDGFTPSEQLPYSDPLAALSNAYPSQSQGATGGNSHHTVLDRRIIPRDYLTVRSKPSPAITGPTVGTLVANEHQTRVVQQNHSNASLEAQTNKSMIDELARQPEEIAYREEDKVPESDVSGQEDVKVSRTRSPEFLATPSSPAKPRTVSKPEYPTSAVGVTPSRINMPRTSSIDSAISTISSTSLKRVAGEVRSPSPTSVRNLIAAAGGAENLITHLLKDKNNVASQNAQLWKLVEKQRALLLGLNKDLDRMTKERDSYRKKAKDTQLREETPVRRPNQSLSREETVSTSEPQRTTHGISGRTQENEFRTPSPHAPLVQSHGLAHEMTASQSVESGSKNDHVNVTHLPRAVTYSGESAGHSASPRSEICRTNTDPGQLSPPAFALTTPSPASEKPSKGSLASRKAPPKPLTLVQSRDDAENVRQMSGHSDLTSIDDEPERGRKRTRDEDDRDRELSSVQSEEARSRSKKDKNKEKKKKEKEESVVPASITILEHKAPIGLPLSPRSHLTQNLLSPNSLPASTNMSLGERMLAGALKSPGLPLSPRPMHNPIVGNSLPVSPRANLTAFPLSPRAPKQPLPAPTNPAAPFDAMALQTNQHRIPQFLQTSPTSTQPDRLHVHEPPTSDPPTVYRGLAVPMYPNLLLPPNALPSIQVKVASSRLRPSRHSMLGLKMHEDATVFSLSIISRSSNSELWRIEKIPSSLPQLEQQLKQYSADLPTTPDRKLFASHSPAVLDARRHAIDTYFDELLDVHIDDQAAVAICRFLSTDVLEPQSSAAGPSMIATETDSQSGARTTKMGYLTKKGKNFGGWKSRYFVLENAELRYYESDDGPHLGTIRLQYSQIGKQKQDGDDQDGQFRHAFLVQEPKRKDSTTFVRHVLCAESDAERDEWVKLLLQYTDASPIAETHTYVEPSHSTDYRANVEKLVSLSEDNRLITDVHSSSPTPTSGSSNLDSPSAEHHRDPRAHAAMISGPMNGGVITNTSTWGNKSVPAAPKEHRDRGYKMSNIFGFKKNELTTNTNDKPEKPRILRHNGYVRPVFGMPLAEAVEFCSPFNIEVELPAVVYRCIEYLRFRNAANDEGLFRLSGSNTTVRMLKDRFNSEGDVDLIGENEYHDVHAVASLFKTYLRELPSTILSRELHIDFVKVLELDHNAEKIAAFNALVHKLPHVNFVLLKTLSQYLVEVTQSADKNKMSVRNMGIVFSPTLNIPTPVLTLFLTEYEGIFEREVDHSSSSSPTSVRSNGTRPQPIQVVPNDVRSPRQQVFGNLSTPGYQQLMSPGLPTNPSDKARVAGLSNLGFMPIQPSYESGNYVSVTTNEQAQPQLQMNIQQPPMMTQATVPDLGGYGSLNGLLAPENAASIKAKRRESAMIFSSKSD